MVAVGEVMGGDDEAGIFSSHLFSIKEDRLEILEENQKCNLSDGRYLWKENGKYIYF